jgi:hypothetical protein
VAEGRIVSEAWVQFPASKKKNEKKKQLCGYNALMHPFILRILLKEVALYKRA